MGIRPNKRNQHGKCFIIVCGNYKPALVEVTFRGKKVKMCPKHAKQYDGR